MRSLIYFKHKLIFTTTFLLSCLLLTGCGNQTAPLGIMSLGTFGVFMAIITSCACVYSLAKLVISTTSQRRGTNSASRFIRHNVNYGVQKTTIKISAIVMIFDVIGVIIGFTVPRVIITLMPVGIIVYAYLLMKKGTEDKQRIQATRDVTKAGLTAGKYAAVAGAAVAAPYAAGAVGAALAAEGAVTATVAAAGAMGATMLTGAEVAKGAERIRGVMEDVDHNRPVREFPELSDGYVISPDEFLKKAVRLGCDTSMDLSQMADVILMNAPEASLNELPPDMDKVEKAARLLGAVHPVEEISSSAHPALPNNS